MSEEINVGRFIELVELNVGHWKPLGVAIVDLNYNVWGKKGNVPKEFFKYFKAPGGAARAAPAAR